MLQYLQTRFCSYYFIIHGFSNGFAVLDMYTLCILDQLEGYISLICLNLVARGALSNHSSTAATAGKRPCPHLLLPSKTSSSPPAPQQDWQARQCGCGEVRHVQTCIDSYSAPRRAVLSDALVSRVDKSTKILRKRTCPTLPEPGLKVSRPEWAAAAVGIMGESYLSSTVDTCVNVWGPKEQRVKSSKIRMPP